METMDALRELLAVDLRRIADNHEGELDQSELRILEIAAQILEKPRKSGECRCDKVVDLEKTRGDLKDQIAVMTNLLKLIQDEAAGKIHPSSDYGVKLKFILHEISEFNKWKENADQNR
jgi:hypothetical protein